jgi:hypothetical protein
MSKHFLAAAGAAAALFAPAVALADPINLVDYSSLSGNQLVTFDDLPITPVPPGAQGVGLYFPGVVVDSGVAFAEKFVGQTQGANFDFDTLSGTPTGPLTLSPGAAGQNVNLITYEGGNVLTGVGVLGNLDADGIGEGALSFLFSSDQSQFGFQLVGGDGGDADLSFFRADGSLIQTVTVNNLADAFYGFQSDGGLKDIRGVSITNLDEGGIGVDNIKYDVESRIPNPNGGVPEPTSWALMLLGFGGLGALLRQSRRRAAWA